MLSSRRCDASAISSTATSNAASCRDDGLENPLTLRTNWRAAARISSSVATTSAWRSVLMLLHMANKDTDRSASAAGGRQLRQVGRRQPRRVDARATQHRAGQLFVAMLDQVAHRVSGGAHELAKRKGRDGAI